VLPSLLKLL